MAVAELAASPIDGVYDKPMSVGVYRGRGLIDEGAFSQVVFCPH